MDDRSRVRISAQNPHLFETADSRPFFFLGDTAWELFHRLTENEIGEYLQNRAAKGFNVVLVNVLAEMDGLTVPNAMGDLPLLDLNPRTPNPAYLDFIERVIQRAADLELHIALLPAWGDKLTAPWGEGPCVFPVDHPDIAFDWAQMLGSRFGGFPNVIWVLGGDRPAYIAQDPASWAYRYAEKVGVSPRSDWRPIWDAMAAGLEAGSSVHPLIAYHPQGGSESTSRFLQDRDWLDVHMIQSGHGGGHDQPIWEWIARDHSLEPVRPTMDAEPNYEDHPVNPWPTWDPANGYFDDYDVRKQCYRSVFAGGAGVVYGHHAVWQFFDERYEAINYADRTWRKAMDRPGAFQVGILRRLIESISGFDRVPDDTLVLSDLGSGASRICACRAIDYQWAMVYVPDSGRVVQVEFDSVGAAYWFNPVNGSETPAVPTYDVFLTPEDGRDWVLVLRRS